MTIGSLSGNGLFNKTKQAKEEHKNARDLENQYLDNYEDEIKKNTEGNDEQIGKEFNIESESRNDSDKYHICDGSILKVNDYPMLAEERKDLLCKEDIDNTPTFTSSNSRVKASGSADGNWLPFLVFSPTLVSSAGSGWISQGGTGEKWISVDLLENTLINKIKIVNVSHQNRTDCVGAPIDFKLKGSYDDSTYEEILNVQGNTHIAMGEEYEYTFDEISYRYYKVEITNGVQWWDGNLFYGFRFLKLIHEEDCIRLPNDPQKIIKVK